MAKTDEGQGMVSADRDRTVQLKLEQLKEEYGKLHELKIATAQNKKNLEAQLEVLRQKAEKEYGTSDVNQLRELLEQRRRDNERMVREYEEHIVSIKEKLESIEKEKG